MKDLLVKTGQWEVAFGDVDHVIENDSDNEEMVEFNLMKNLKKSLMKCHQWNQVKWMVYMYYKEDKCDNLEDFEVLEKK